MMAVDDSTPQGHRGSNVYVEYFIGVKPAGSNEGGVIALAMLRLKLATRTCEARVRVRRWSYHLFYDGTGNSCADKADPSTPLSDEDSY